MLTYTTYCMLLCAGRNVMAFGFVVDIITKILYFRINGLHTQPACSQLLQIANHKWTPCNMASANKICIE